MVPKGHILVVDDERFCREAVAGLLEREGYHVIPAVDGRDAIEKLESFRPDLIIVDQKMPDMTGLELLEVVRKNAQFDRTGAMMLTAFGDRHCVKRAKELNVADYVLKSGFSARNLIERVRRYFDPTSSTPPQHRTRPLAA
jgi:CheY-like chemotaxis protein